MATRPGKPGQTLRTPPTKPVVAPSNSLDLTDDADKAALASKFIAEHPKGLSAEEVAASEVDPAIVDAPLEDAPSLEAVAAVETPPADAVAPVEAPPVEGAAPAVDAPVVEKPAAAVVAEPAAAVEPTAAKPVYDPQEKFALAEGAEWTREQVIQGLQERAELKPLAEQADGFRTLFNMDLEAARKEWAPVLETLAKDPVRAKAMQDVFGAAPAALGALGLVLGADPAKIEYLIDSAQFWDQKVADGSIKVPAQPAAATPAQPAAAAVPLDPRIKEALDYVEHQKAQAGSERAKREWSDVTTRYPFLLSDNAVRESLLTTANAMYQQDIAKGIPDLECRHMGAAVEANAALLDARLTVMRHQQNPAPTPPAVAAAPSGEPVAILGTSGAAPSVPSSRRESVYRGDPDNAVKAFLKNER